MIKPEYYNSLLPQTNVLCQDDIFQQQKKQKSKLLAFKRDILNVCILHELGLQSCISYETFIYFFC